ncbi:MAG: SDR family NAD(P)-dependent oxidoreductase, partial [Deinococcota bacterium]|nr:SDR family NAD(P)-dependent oxidoreductase [Deinococcota bacterium]
MRRLSGKPAVVTGAASGIGRAIARRFIEEGARVLVADIDLEAASEAASALGENALPYEVDVTLSAQVQGMVRHAVATWGGLEVMVNNAGAGVAATTPDTTEEDWQRVIDVNLKGTFLGMKYAIPAIRESGGGSVINMASIASLVGLPDRAAYCAAKGGILALTRAAAIDHVAEGVRVNCIAPGTVDTPWVARITAGYDDPEA